MINITKKQSSKRINLYWQTQSLDGDAIASPAKSPILYTPARII
ncbi:MAG TPA: hypothetical protein VK184_18725 [Nostocaceae cyanobacterium]|nr:hypothetical protein [Nostocaceae cyanobacterium]